MTDETHDDRATARAVRVLLGLVPAVFVLGFAGWLLWPVPAGVMPLSADHTVHLTRIALTAERLGSTGSLSGWDPTWFFGFPLGELYPQLGDLLIIAIHALGLGALDWPSAYALGFYLVFAIQGLVLIRVGRLFGFGPWPGLIAALLMLVDAGFTREGGWMYTVYFGVWPQALATSLAWLGLGELARALGWQPSQVLAARDPERGAPSKPSPDAATRATLAAGLCFGAALLAHPIALPTLAIGGLLLIVTLIPRAPVDWRSGLARCVLAGLIGALLAAWWWVPMLQHKAWMASYGWLFAPLETMTRWLVEDGRWAQRMPAAVGFVALGGIVLAALGAGRVARFVALFTLVQWLLASSDLFWQLRLDRFSEGFTHIQYQRFLIGAKPGLFLCAGLAMIAPAGWARRLFVRREQLRWPERLAGLARLARPNKLAIVGALALAPVSAALGLWLLDDSRATIAEYEVGAVQTERMPGDPEFEADYQAFLAWAREQWDAREHDYRIAVRDHRNRHLFMDAPVWTRTPQYKLGFTPGDNFVHKPETGQRELLDKLGVRFIVALDRGRARPRRGEVARFGKIHVREHHGAARGIAWLEGGDGELELLDADLRGGLVRVRVKGVDEGARVVFGIAGYPRWQLTLDGEPLEWVEDPVHGDAAPISLAAREAGELRGGKAGGDDGTEPTLIAAELPPGTDGAVLELRYLPRNGLEWLAEVSSLLTWLGLGIALAGRGARSWGPRARERLAGLEQRVARALHPLTLMILVPALLGLGYARWQLAAEREASELLGWIEAGAANTERVETGPVKAEMLIRPAVIMRPRPGEPAVIELELDELPEHLDGWIGIDDDQAKSPGRWAHHELSFEVRWSGSSEAQWFEFMRVQVPHEARRIEFHQHTGTLSLLPVYLRVTAFADGKRLPRLGLNLELQQQPRSNPDDDPAP
ncbi:hypothetical protein ENSA5_03610 [Enhygromyxa salina]|uniref:Bacterial membrane protein YfhO n=1 Tax=Enhygromyxa salina TaxID=215803 RepID=A0A2S9YJV4_9BACT|nr:hypothetical protein [Enhygromyxa salina]PRQ05371.1 hypothetical protein ENSA5_03610 [Enhygromyxa salina]